MAYSTFNQNKNDQLKEPMFLGQSVNVARYDQQKFEIFEKLIEKQLSFFWRPEEVLTYLATVLITTSYLTMRSTSSSQT
ncbi:hypothetical protein OGZ01_12280 [Vibrio harveyi]|nr:hypothetical protein [Vibrio harveyi]